MGADRTAVAIGQRAVVLDQAFEGLPRDVQPAKRSVAALERGDDAQRLGVVVEPAAIGQALIKRALAGMAERRMSEIVAERAGFGQILVEPERAGERARDLR